jgi:hypothetical protein
MEREMRGRTRVRPKQDGQSMVELALILPFLLLLLVATVEAGFVLRDYLMVQAVNREGVRWAVRTPPTEGDEQSLDFFAGETNEVFERIRVAAAEAGLRNDDLGIVLTHIYLVDSDGDHVYDQSESDVYASPPIAGFAIGTRLDVAALADHNFEKHAEISALREGSAYEALDDELVVVEVFYRHETLWGMDIVGPFGEDFVMYAQSSMRMIGTGR